MFYEIEKLEAHLKCPKCEYKYLSPRILPCGKSMCQSCIEQLYDADYLNGTNHRNNKIFCPLCSKIHAIPEGGFTINEFIIKTMEMKPQKVYRCPSYETFDSLLNVMQANVQEIESKIKFPDVQIRDYCDKLRNQVDVSTETLLEKINLYRDKMLNEIKLYEQKSVKQFKQIDKKESYLKLVKENMDVLIKYQNYLNQPHIDEAVVVRMIQEAKVQEYKLKNILKQINGKLFGDNLLHFDESSLEVYDPSLIGRLESQSLLIESDLLDIDKVMNPKISQTVEFTDNSIVQLALPLFNNKYLVSTDMFLKIIEEINNKAQLITEIKFDFKPEFFSHNGQDSILVQHNRHIWRNNRKEKSLFNTFGIYDYNLNLKHETTLNVSIIACATSNHTIFIQAAEAENICMIHAYSWSLEKLTIFGQSYYVDRPFFFSKNYELKLVKNEKMYFKKVMNNDANSNDDENEDICLRVVSLNNGEFLSEYYLNGTFSIKNDNSDLFVDALNRTFIIDDIYSSIKIYDGPNMNASVGTNLQLLMETAKSLDLNNCSSFRFVNINDHTKLVFVRNKKIIEIYSLN